MLKTCKFVLSLLCVLRSHVHIPTVMSPFSDVPEKPYDKSNDKHTNSNIWLTLFHTAKERLQGCSKKIAAWCTDYRPHQATDQLKGKIFWRSHTRKSEDGGTQQPESIEPLADEYRCCPIFCHQGFQSGQVNFNKYLDKSEEGFSFMQCDEEERSVTYIRCCSRYDYDCNCIEITAKGKKACGHQNTLAFKEGQDEDREITIFWDEFFQNSSCIFKQTEEKIKAVRSMWGEISFCAIIPSALQGFPFCRDVKKGMAEYQHPFFFYWNILFTEQ